VNAPTRAPDRLNSAHGQISRYVPFMMGGATRRQRRCGIVSMHEKKMLTHEIRIDSGRSAPSIDIA
jgi:hypothetical protein